MKYLMFGTWLLCGALMVWMNDFNYDTIGWFFLVASPLCLLRNGL